MDARAAGARFRKRVTRRISEAAKRMAKPRIAESSKTLSRALEIVRLPTRGRSERAVLQVPHYWAEFVHNGRRPFRKRRFMVWWRDPRRDPRLRNGKYPRTRDQLRRLTPQEFVAAKEERDRWIKSGGSPETSPVIITKNIRKATKENPFFSHEAGGGLVNLASVGERIMESEMDNHVSEVMGDLMNVKETIRIRI